MKNKVNHMVKASLFLALAIVFQDIGKSVPQISQVFVGPAVNAILILTTYICGIGWGIGVGALTPLLAWLTGQLAAPLGPFVPFIMIGNGLFVLCFGLLKQYKKIGIYIGVLLGAFAKFLFLYLSASKFIIAFHINIPPKIAEKLLISMGLPQLITALIGGTFALIIIKLLIKRKQLT